MQLLNWLKRKNSNEWMSKIIHLLSLWCSHDYFDQERRIHFWWNSNMACQLNWIYCTDFLMENLSSRPVTSSSNAHRGEAGSQVIQSSRWGQADHLNCHTRRFIWSAFVCWIPTRENMWAIKTMFQYSRCRRMFRDCDLDENRGASLDNYYYYSFLVCEYLNLMWMVHHLLGIYQFNMKFNMYRRFTTQQKD